MSIAKVAVDVGLAHLDRPFDYVIPDALDEVAQPGVRVRVRFAGRLVDGFLLERVEASEHGGQLAPIAKVVSAEPVLAPEIARLAREVADRYAGTLSDVLRLAIPPRHARTEAEPVREAADVPAPPAAGEWSDYVAGTGFLEAMAVGAPRAVWRALPGSDWPAQLAVAAQTALAAGRGALVVVPDARDLTRVSASLADTLGADRFVALSADLGPAERYRRWLAVRRGAVRCVVGTRAAAFAPVADLGLVACWDDGDDLHKEPRAPYPHARDVLVLRAHLAGAAALVGGFVPSVEAEQLVVSGWARPVAPARETLRARAPKVTVAGDEVHGPTRLPTVAWKAAREALAAGRPVLVQVPRSGYQPGLSCSSCRTPARCAHCHGPLARGADAAALSCAWCGRPAGEWSCAVCRRTEVRSNVVGSRRTAEELGRAFPGVAVRTSDRELVLDRVALAAVLVVATPGAEPVAEGGYGAVLLLDSGLLLSRPDLRAAEEALRRWAGAGALAAADGRVVITADSRLPVVQALLRWDPATFTAREAGERAALRFPPATRMASVEGAPEAVAELLAAALPWPDGTEVLGPVANGDGERALVRTPRENGAALADRLAAAHAARAARKAALGVKVELDPLVVL